MSKIDLSRYNIRTDLIIERDNIIHEEKNIDDITITTSNEDGHYVTLSFDDVTDSLSYDKVCKCLKEIISDILKLNNIDENDKCLVVGLGNRYSTPDSLGVKVLDDIVVTGHLFALEKVSPGYRNVSCFAPGVMANTGIESFKIIKSLIKEIKPDFIIAIDALASRNIERVNKTIQVTDTGIHPGSGIDNNRMEINSNTIGIPVIAIGVPTVVLSSTIVYDTLEYLVKHISYIKDNESINKLSFKKSNYLNKIKNRELNVQDKGNLLGLFGTLDDNERHSLISEVLDNTDLNLIVTPTEIDFLIDKISSLIAKSINSTLHRQIN